MEEYSEIRILGVRTQNLEAQMTLARADIDKLQEQGRDSRADLDRMILLIAGDEDYNMPGLIERTKSVEAARRLTMLGLAVTTLTSLATLAAVLFK
ncbi:MAG: hypothetical protein BroJett011_03870 [Chloroflexota bacterium]|nr:MAG: hypothetical protein BroJett011_03870 [Chloroflexota bacterium]